MSTSEESKASRVRVFISYSHDSPEHCDRVFALAQQLRRDGIDAELDQFHQEKLLHWPRWCEEQLRPEKSDFVLCICTPDYRRRIEGRAPVDVGKGVFWEGTLIYNYLYDEKGNRRCLPVLLDKNPKDIPSILGGYTRFELDVFGLENLESPYSKLYRLLTRQTTKPMTQVGALQKLPPLPGEERRTDFILLIGEAIKRDTEEILAILKDRAPPASNPERPHNLPPWMAPEYFIGRKEQLRALWEALSAPGANALAVVQPHVVRGGGGIGKTRLAIQAVWALYLGGKCDMAFFVSASPLHDLVDRKEDVSTIWDQLAALDAPSLLDLYKGQEPPRELAARRQNVIQALREKAGRWILLLDAADSQEARDVVNGLLKELAGGRFVITSRRDDWSKGTVRKLSLELFTIEEARDCLLSRYWKPEPPADELGGFENVANELEFLPLALVLAASYMELCKITPLRYLKDFREKHDLLLDFSAQDVDYDRSLLAAFRLSYDQLQSPQRSLLHVLCWLAPEPFPRQLVEESEAIRRLLAGGGEDAKSVDAISVLGELQTVSLLELDEESLRLHKLILDCTQAVQDDETRSSSFLSALQWIAERLPSPDFDVAGWAMWGRLGPHLEALIQRAESFRLKDDSVALICGQYGSLLYNEARHAEAEPLMRRALEIHEKSYGTEHPNVAIGLNNLAQLLKATNRLGEAEPLIRRALEIDEKSYGPEHPDVAGDLNNLAGLLQDTNRPGEAEPLSRRALAIDEKSYGPEHPKVAVRLNNLAGLLQDTNRLGEAEPLYRRALAIDEKIYGPEHPDVARDLNNLAGLLQATNRLGEAEPLMRRALAIAEKSYGPEHPNVATALSTLAQSLQAMNRLVEAERLMRRALEIGEKIYGLEHPKVAIYLNNLAQLLKATNRLGEAEPLMRRALAIDEKSYGPDYPKAAIRLNNLAGLLQDTNRLGEAEPLMKRALVILLKFTHETGHAHPHLRGVLYNYFALLKEMSLGEEEIRKRIAQVGIDAGLDPQSYDKLLGPLL